MERTRTPMLFLDEPKSGSLTIGYAPDHDQAPTENPPRFSWLPALDDAARYVLRISTDQGFGDGKTQVFADIPWNFVTPDVALAPGDWFWSYALWDKDNGAVASKWSRTRAFHIAPDLPQTPLPAHADRYRDAPTSHPRLWLDEGGIASLRKAIKADPAHAGWDVFYDKSVKPWRDREIIAEPQPYPNNIRVATLWRQMYIDCQEVIYAIRHLAIAGRVLGDQALLDRAKDWLLAVAAWDPKGATARSYNDEAAFRVAVALAWGYDWLHDQMSDAERDTVRAVLLERSREVATHVMANARIHIFPYDSHAVRSLSAVLTITCIALLDDEPEARGWLDYTIDFLSTLYSPWGGADGGWAEGSHYWMTGMAYLIDAANLIRNFCGIDLYQRPFFQKTGYFPFYTKAPGTRRTSFGDDSTMGDLPGLKVGYNVRQYAGVTGDPHLQWFFDAIKKDAAGTEMEFYNYGWWDLNFDDLVYRNDFAQIEAKAPTDLEPMRWFKDVGWVAVQKHMADPDRHLQMIVKASPYGSLSHSHGDQGAFLLHAFGEDLAVQSGYYVAFNSSMHVDWRRQTRSKNAVLIGGQGQYAGKDKALAKSANGRIVDAENRGDHIFIATDSTAAYAATNLGVLKAQRDYYLSDQDYLVIVDRVETATAAPIQWLCHTNGPIEIGSNSFRYTGEKAGMYGQVVFASSGKASLTTVEGYPGIDPEDYKGLPVHHHVQIGLPAAQKHTLVTLLVPYAKADPRRIFHFIDDQGFSVDLYFTDVDDRRLRIVIPKEF